MKIVVMEFEATERVENEIYMALEIAAVHISAHQNQLIRLTIETVPRTIEVGSRWRGDDSLVRVVERIDPQPDPMPSLVTYRRESDGWEGRQYSNWWLEFNTFIGYVHDEIQDP